ncbi:MAG: right-handed parallel beta-helix repeat-containing protein [Micropruina sp.]|uniref:right-handed parallel beta-helix repeat-containing protein n=1 Tax=Micropruina sp. TaxID=2737536 RepID=UPI0039E2A4E6
MSVNPRRRVLTILAASATTFTGLAAAPTAQAADVNDALAAFGITGNVQVVPIGHTGDVTAELIAAAKSAAPANQPRIITLPAGSVQVKERIRMADNVYLVADPATSVLLTATADQLLWFNAVKGGVYGGNWDSSHRSDTVIGAKASTVRLAHLTVRNANENGIVAYTKSSLTLADVASTGNNDDGIHSESSTVTATRVRSTANRRNGLQLSTGSVGTIVDSTLDGNGLAVTGSTTNKTGHGLGLSSSRATVTGTTMSSNKVCGVSLTSSAEVSLVRTTVSSNGRHGLGTVPGVKASMTDSVVANNGYNGVLASGSKTQVQLTRVTISGTAERGLSVPSNGTATIQGSTFTTSKGKNISVSAGGSLTVLSDNQVTAGSIEGITVSDKANITVNGTGNVVKSNGSTGLVISGKGTTGRINKAMRFETNGKYGILVKAKGKLTTVTNTFVSNKSTTMRSQSGGKITKIKP